MRKNIGRIAKFIAYHRYVLLIAGASLVGLTLVIISMYLYQSSGAAQLDLSRPGYNDVRDQVQPPVVRERFSSSGVIDEAAIAQFRRLYSRQQADVEALNSFQGQPLSDEALGVDDPALRQ